MTTSISYLLTPGAALVLLPALVLLSAYVTPALPAGLATGAPDRRGAPETICDAGGGTPLRLAGRPEAMRTTCGLARGEGRAHAWQEGRHGYHGRH